MLNESQEKAAYTKEPFLFLLAGAGTGKTSVIVARIKYLIDKGVLPEHILAITFTKKAATEMRHRINDENVSVHTFHQFCYQQLKTHMDYTYHIVSEGLPINDEALLSITKYKNSMYQNKRPKLYAKYQQYLSANNLKDFDDLLLDFHRHFHKFSKHIKYEYIFIDEFQDTNILQYKIIKKMIMKNTKIFCVGDPDQSIYKFRGSSTEIINMFVTEHKAKILYLTTNYRSTENIISLANSLIKGNNRRYKKRLIAFNNASYKQRIIKFRTQNEEAKSIISIIKNHQKSGIKSSEIAVLFRNHKRCYLLRESLANNDIIYQDKSSKKDDQNSINLLSLHQAKGLEFSVVFIIGLEQGSLPSHHAKTNADLEEERRLFFVGVTRAKHYLYLSFTQINNESVHVKKSIFLKDLNTKLIEH